MLAIIKQYTLKKKKTHNPVSLKYITRNVKQIIKDYKV